MGIFRWYAKFKKRARVEKRIVCLANSDMKSGRCIVGKEIVDGSWIRPVNGKQGKGLSGGECLCGDGSEPNVLDIIEVPLTEKASHGHQSENWLIGRNLRWKRTGRFSWGDLGVLVDDPKVLWENDNRKNDRVSLGAIQNFSHSVYLVRVEDMVLWGSLGQFGTKVHGGFTWRGISYNLAVTDPAIKLSAIIGKQVIGECYVTVSLAAEPFESGFSHEPSYYKLIAAIITPERVEERS